MAEKNSPLKKTRACLFCVDSKKRIDYKDTQTLRRYLSSFAKIVPRKRSGVCMAHQRELSTAIKRARIMALVPFVQK